MKIYYVVTSRTDGNIIFVSKSLNPAKTAYEKCDDANPPKRRYVSAEQYIREYDDLVDYYRDRANIESDAQKSPDLRKELTERICIDCGKAFWGRTSSKRCGECQAKKDKAYQSQYRVSDKNKQRVRDRYYANKAKYTDGIPQSGVKGIYFVTSIEEWIVNYQGQYYGCFADVNDAIDKLHQIKSSLPPKPRKPRAKSNKPPKSPKPRAKSNKPPKPGNPLSPDFRAAKQSGVKGVNWVAYRERWRVEVKGKSYGEYKNLEDALKKRAEIKVTMGI